MLIPNDSVWDLDGDGLVDFDVRWADDGSGVDPTTLAVMSLEGADGQHGPVDLTTFLDTDGRDSTGATFHETVARLLPPVAARVVVSVRDRAGNIGADSQTVALPHAALHRTILSGSGGGWLASGLVACGDQLYLGGRSTLVSIDPALLTVTRVVPPDSTGNDPYEISRLLCAEDQGILYASDWRLKRFELETGTWLPQVATSFPSNGLAQSRRDPRVIFLGYSGTGRLALYRSDLDSVVAAILPRVSGEQVLDIAVLPDDRKVYLTRYLEGGILVVDPWADSVLGRISVGGSWSPSLGATDALTLSRDGTKLYAAVVDGGPRGVLEIDTASDRILRTLPLPWMAIDVALSPDETRMFVTTQDLFQEEPSENVLVDVAAWQPLTYFPRPHSPDTFRWDRQIVFSDDGKLVFVGHNFDVDVYVTRR